MNAAVENFVNELYDELKADLPELSELALKSLIFDKIRQKAGEQAELMLEIAYTTELVKCLAALVRLS